MNNMLSIYHISPGYRRVVIWEAYRLANERICRTTCIPNLSLGRRARYASICSRLMKLGIKLPVYVPTKREKKG